MFGPHEAATDARKLSAKLPVEQAPSVIAEPPAADAHMRLGLFVLLMLLLQQQQQLPMLPQ